MEEEIRLDCVRLAIALAEAAAKLYDRMTKGKKPTEASDEHDDEEGDPR